MVKVVEYGTYIIDIADAMIEHRKGLKPEQVQILNHIFESAQSLVTHCLQHEQSDLTTLYYFLTGQAILPVKRIINHCEFMLRTWKLHPAYRDGIKKIHMCIRAIRQELTQMRDDLIAFMEKIGIPIPDKRYIHKPDPLIQNRASTAEDLMQDPRMRAPMPTSKKQKSLRRLKARPS